MDGVVRLSALGPNSGHTPYEELLKIQSIVGGALLHAGRPAFSKIDISRSMSRQLFKSHCLEAYTTSSLSPSQQSNTAKVL